MMLNRIKVFLVAALFMGVAFLMAKGKIVEAKTVPCNGVIVTSGNAIMNIDGTDTLADSSGVKELDQAAERTNKLINWICGWIGGIMALFGFIWAAMNQAGHNTESRNMGIIVGAIGVVIAFAPSIVKWILGK